MDLITSQDALKALYKKMAPPLVTLLSSEPEIQYVALRNINLIVQKRPTILAHEIKVPEPDATCPRSGLWPTACVCCTAGLLLQVQRPDLRQDGEAGDHDQARLRAQRRPSAHGAQGVLDGGGRRVRAAVRSAPKAAPVRPPSAPGSSPPLAAPAPAHHATRLLRSAGPCAPSAGAPSSSNLPYISPTSPLHLPYISAISSL